MTGPLATTASGTLTSHMFFTPRPGASLSWYVLNHSDHFLLSRLAVVPVCFTSIVDPLADIVCGSFSVGNNLLHGRVKAAAEDATGTFWRVLARLPLCFTNLSTCINPEWARSAFPEELKSSQPRRNIVALSYEIESQAIQKKLEAEHKQRDIIDAISPFLSEAQVKELLSSAGIDLQYEKAVNFCLQRLQEFYAKPNVEVAVEEEIRRVLEQLLPMLSQKQQEQLQEQSSSSASKLESALELFSENIKYSNSNLLEFEEAILSNIKLALKVEERELVRGSVDERVAVITRLLPPETQEKIAKELNVSAKLALLVGHFAEAAAKRPDQVEAQAAPALKDEAEREQMQKELADAKQEEIELRAVLEATVRKGHSLKEELTAALRESKQSQEALVAAKQEEIELRAVLEAAVTKGHSLKEELAAALQESKQSREALETSSQREQQAQERVSQLQEQILQLQQQIAERIDANKQEPSQPFTPLSPAQQTAVELSTSSSSSSSASPIDGPRSLDALRAKLTRFQELVRGLTKQSNMGKVTYKITAEIYEEVSQNVSELASLASSIAGEEQIVQHRKSIESAWGFVTTTKVGKDGATRNIPQTVQTKLSTAVKTFLDGLPKTE